jgi:hypothetical protein
MDVASLRLQVDHASSADLKIHRAFLDGGSAKRRQLTEFFAAGLAEVPQRVQRAALHHRAQLREGLVRQAIGVDDDSNELFCPLCNAGVRDNPHFVDRTIKDDKRWNCGLIVNERIETGRATQPTFEPWRFTKAVDRSIPVFAGWLPVSI